jgi:hypothetical protein
VVQGVGSAPAPWGPVTRPPVDLTGSGRLEPHAVARSTTSTVSAGRSHMGSDRSGRTSAPSRAGRPTGHGPPDGGSVTRSRRPQPRTTRPGRRTAELRSAVDHACSVSYSAASRRCCAGRRGRPVRAPPTARRELRQQRRSARRRCRPGRQGGPQRLDPREDALTAVATTAFSAALQKRRGRAHDVAAEPLPGAARGPCGRPSELPTRSAPVSPLRTRSRVSSSTMPVEGPAPASAGVVPWPGRSTGRPRGPRLALQHGSQDERRARARGPAPAETRSGPAVREGGHPRDARPEPPSPRRARVTAC